MFKGKIYINWREKKFRKEFDDIKEIEKNVEKKLREKL